MAYTFLNSMIRQGSLPSPRTRVWQEYDTCRTQVTRSQVWFDTPYNMSWAQNHVSEVELMEVLLEYLAKPEFKKWHSDDSLGSCDGWTEYDKGRDIEALWHLVSDVSLRVAGVLVQYLPEGSGLTPWIPTTVLEGLDDRLLELLLWREDIGLKELREKIFLEHVPKDEGTNTLPIAAISHNFDLEYDEFGVILARSEIDRVALLMDLAGSADDLSLCIRQAIHDVLTDTNWTEEVDPHGVKLWDAVQRVNRSVECGCSELTGRSRPYELKEWRLYRLAKRAAPWNEDERDDPPSDDLEFLA